MGHFIKGGALVCGHTGQPEFLLHSPLHLSLCCKLPEGRDVYPLQHLTVLAYIRCSINN